MLSFLKKTKKLLLSLILLFGAFQSNTVMASSKHNLKLPSKRSKRRSENKKIVKAVTLNLFTINDLENFSDRDLDITRHYYSKLRKKYILARRRILLTTEDDNTNRALIPFLEDKIEYYNEILHKIV